MIGPKMGHEKLEKTQFQTGAAHHGNGRPQKPWWSTIAATGRAPTRFHTWNRLSIIDCKTFASISITIG